MDRTPYHEGEQELQARFGLREKMDQIGRRVIRDFMPDEHRELFAQLPWLLVGSLDDAGRPWASVLTGDPGFIASPDSQSLQVSATPLHGDILASNLRPGVPVGLLGLEPQTRRRNRLNGTVSRLTAGEIEIGVDQSFGNCPKYINRRVFEWRSRSASAPEISQELTPRAREMVSTADMLYVASAFLPNTDLEPRHGVDVSHRGGKRGFVRIEADSSLTIPDYSGNFAFNTLGNITKDGRCGLLFLDFDNGDMLQLTARACIDWDAPEVGGIEGVERLLRVQPVEVRLMQGAFPLRATTLDSSPNLENIGSISSNES